MSRSQVSVDEARSCDGPSRRKDTVPWLVTDWVTVFQHTAYVEFLGPSYDGPPVLLLGTRYTQRPDGSGIVTRVEVREPSGRSTPFPALESECEDFVWCGGDRGTRLAVKVVAVAEFSTVLTYWEGRLPQSTSWEELPGTRIVSQVTSTGLTTLQGSGQ